MLLLAVADLNWEVENFLGNRSLMKKEMVTGVFPVNLR